MKDRTLLIAAFIVAVGAFGSDAGAPASAQQVAPTAADNVGPVCGVAPGSIEIPQEIRETSGLVRGHVRPDVLWTHNDGSSPVLYALATDGSVLSRVTIEGVELEDWEDLGAGPCPESHCLFIADTGDNDGEREQVIVYRIAEPAPGVDVVGSAVALLLRFPDGSWDTEAIFITQDGTIHLVTKGREGPVALYRTPPSAASGELTTLERIRELFPASPANEDRITGGGISPDGRWVGIRSKSSLYFYPAESLLAGSGDAPDPTVIDLRPLGEPQGESLAIDADGTVWLTSEAGSRDAEPLLSRIQCSFPA